MKIVYDAESDYKVDNEATIKIARLDDNDAVIPRTVTEGIRHNKFIVLLNGVTPVAVWTGSTNISAGGIFGHSNVGHVVWDEDMRGNISTTGTGWRTTSPRRSAARARTRRPRRRPRKAAQGIRQPALLRARQRGKQRDTPVVRRPARRGQGLPA